MLCVSLVAEASALAHAASASVRFVCGDAARADLGATGILYLNDAAWPPVVRESMFATAERDLPAAAVVVAAHDWPGALPPRAHAEDSVVVDVAWEPRKRFFVWTLA